MELLTFSTVLLFSHLDQEVDALLGMFHTNGIRMYLYVPDFRPRIRISRSGCRRFMRALRVLLTEYFIVQGDCFVSTQVCSVST